MSTLSRAIQIATQAHEGQLDKSGKAYIGHPLRVMEMVTSENEKIVGVLHDLIEDTDWTFEMLEAEGFSAPTLSMHAGRNILTPSIHGLLKTTTNCSSCGQKASRSTISDNNSAASQAPSWSA